MSRIPAFEAEGVLQQPRGDFLGKEFRPQGEARCREFRPCSVPSVTTVIYDNKWLVQGAKSTVSRTDTKTETYDETESVNSSHVPFDDNFDITIQIGKDFTSNPVFDTFESTLDQLLEEDDEDCESNEETFETPRKEPESVRMYCTPNAFL